MKKFKYIPAGTVLFSFLIFQGCQNCDEAVKTAQQGFDSRLTTVSDSIKTAWSVDIDAIRADYESRISSLDSTLAAKAQTSGKAPAKKPAAPATAPKKEEPVDPKKAKMGGEQPSSTDDKKSKMSGEDKKAEELLEQKKSKMGGSGNP